MLEVRSLGRSYTNMLLMYLLAKHQRQCWRSLCFHQVSEPLLSYHHHHHHFALSARISLTLFHYHSLSSITSGRSSGLHPVSTQNCCMLVRPAFTRPCEGVHQSTSLMNSSLLLQLCPACLVRLIVIVFMMGGWWAYSCCFVRCCLQDLFNIARSILV